MDFFRAIAWSLIKRLIRHQFPNVHSLSTQELAEWLSASGIEKPVLLDTRTCKEYQISHLQDAKLVPSELEELNLAQTTPIVTYCSVGYRSARVAQQLQAMNYRTVFNLEGLIFEWINQGYPVYQGKQTVKQVHPFNATWGQLLKPDPQFAKLIENKR